MTVRHLSTSDAFDTSAASEGDLRVPGALGDRETLPSTLGDVQLHAAAEERAVLGWASTASIRPERPTIFDNSTVSGPSRSNRRTTAPSVSGRHATRDVRSVSEQRWSPIPENRARTPRRRSGAHTRRGHRVESRSCSARFGCIRDTARPALIRRVSLYPSPRAEWPATSSSIVSATNASRMSSITIFLRASSVLRANSGRYVRGMSPHVESGCGPMVRVDRLPYAV